MITQQQIADHLGVSHTTVSRALSRDPQISDNLRKRVDQAARSLGYSRAKRASGPRKSAQTVIPVFFCHPAVDHEMVETAADGFHLKLIQGMTHAARQLGFPCVLHTVTDWSVLATEGDELGLDRAPVTVLIGNVPPAIVAQLRAKGVRVILGDAEIPGSGADSVRSDHIHGGHLAAGYLLDQGFERIGLVGGPPGFRPYRLRLDGARLELLDRGLPLDRLQVRFSEELSFKAYQQVVEDWLAAGDLPEAIIAPAGIIGLAVSRVLERHGLKIPDDHSLVSFDNCISATLIHPTPTRVGTYPEAIGRAIAERLGILINPRTESEPQKTLVPVRLVEGHSVRTAASGSFAAPSAHGARAEDAARSPRRRPSPTSEPVVHSASNTGVTPDVQNLPSR